MNMLKRGESDFERMQRIGSIAKTKASQDGEFAPVKLTVTDLRLRTHKVTGFDVFNMTMVYNQQRGREFPTLSIRYITEDKFAEWVKFVIDPSTFQLIAYIPNTENNKKYLASHLKDNVWVFEGPDGLAEEIQEMCDKMTHTQNPQRNRAPMSHQASQTSNTEIERLLAENARLKDAMAAQTVGDVPVIPQSAPDDSGKEELPDHYWKSKARDYIATYKLDELEKIKMKSTKWWITAEYRKLLAETIELLKKEQVNAEH